MNTELLLSDKRFRWISKVYFYVSAIPTFNINPIRSLTDFLDLKVGDLSWGSDQDTRNFYKLKFGRNFQKVLSAYGYDIPPDELISTLKNDTMSNKNFVIRLTELVQINHPQISLAA